MVDETRVVEAAREPRHVVIADKGLRDEDVEERVLPVERPGEFEEIAVVERAPDRLPQFVLRHRVDARLFDEADIVAVNDLAEEIGVWMLRANPRQHARPEA